MLGRVLCTPQQHNNPYPFTSRWGLQYTLGGSTHTHTQTHLCPALAAAPAAQPRLSLPGHASCLFVCRLVCKLRERQHLSNMDSPSPLLCLLGQRACVPSIPWLRCIEPISNRNRWRPDGSPSEARIECTSIVRVVAFGWDQDTSQVRSKSIDRCIDLQRGTGAAASGFPLSHPTCPHVAVDTKLLALVVVAVVVIRVKKRRINDAWMAPRVEKRPSIELATPCEAGGAPLESPSMDPRAWCKRRRWSMRVCVGVGSSCCVGWLDDAISL